MKTPKTTARQSRLIRQRSTKNADQLAQIARLVALEARQSELEKRISDLERETNRQLPHPWISSPLPAPGLPPRLPEPMEDLDDARCHVCNNPFKSMTNFVCTHNRCPTRVWCGDTTRPVFTCGGPSSSVTVGALTVPKPGPSPYGAPGAVFDKNMLVGHGITTDKSIS